MMRLDSYLPSFTLCNIMKNKQFLHRLKVSVIAVFAMTLTDCGTNPVTKKSEIQFVSESSEIAMGKQNYIPARQAQGGDYVIDAELTAYVQSVGNKLAAVSDRKLPYEFVVLNNSVPNAWAMPGGKIAFNRGLLYELNSEAELAAVLSHEIVHAAARHGAKSIERGVFMQGAALAVGVLAGDSNYAGLIVGSGQVGLQLVSTKYGRDAESESDLYGMRYMKLAGYDPTAAVTLQETFVRLSKDRKTNFLEGLFASHPPSDARVAANKVTLAQIGAGGEWGREVYAQKVGKLKATQAAYKNFDEATKALVKGDAKQANVLVKQALAGEPREPRFQELLGDISLSEKKPELALGFYRKAIEMQSDYFKPHVQSGIALVNLGRKKEAEPYFRRANELLPNAPSYFYLGEFAEERGDFATALQNYQAAAGSDSAIGKASTERFVRLDLPSNPSRYLRGALRRDGRGNVYAVVENGAPMAVGQIRLHVVKYDQKNRKPIEQSREFVINSGIASKKQAQVQIANLQLKTDAELKFYRVVIDGAQLLGGGLTQ